MKNLAFPLIVPYFEPIICSASSIDTTVREGLTTTGI